VSAPWPASSWRTATPAPTASTEGHQGSPCSGRTPWRAPPPPPPRHPWGAGRPLPASAGSVRERTYPAAADRSR
jgi:hypothetical protein